MKVLSGPWVDVGDVGIVQCDSVNFGKSPGDSDQGGSKLLFRCPYAVTYGRCGPPRLVGVILVGTVAGTRGAPGGVARPTGLGVLPPAPGAGPSIQYSVTNSVATLPGPIANATIPTPPG